jgi:RNA polymerase sigma factor (sigma-70 family)
MMRISLESQRELEDLLSQARAGSRKAFQELIEPFQRAIRIRIRRRRERRLIAKISDSDLCQICYLKSFEDLSQFQGNTFEEFACWLLSITDHVCQGVHQAYFCQARDVSREVPLKKVEMILTTDSSTGQEERNRLFETAWGKLAARYQLVIQLHDWEKCSFIEIGRRMGLSPDAAKHLHRRAFRKLAERAEKLREE